jgi:hypothetical protein
LRKSSAYALFIISRFLLTATGSDLASVIRARESAAQTGVIVVVAHYRTNKIIMNSNTSVYQWPSKFFVSKFCNRSFSLAVSF